MSAWRRSVQLIETASAAHGTSATSEFQAAPPPYETPQPPIRGVRDVRPVAQPAEDGLHVRDLLSAHRSRRGRLEPPCPRASNASTA